MDTYVDVPIEYKDKEWWDMVKCPSKIEHQYFGFELHDEDFQEPADKDVRLHFPGLKILQVDTGYSEVKNEEKMFKISLTIKPFEWKNIHVAVVKGLVVIKCQHKLVEEGKGLISRNLERSYILPQRCDGNKIKAYVYGSILLIECPKDEQPEMKKVTVGVMVGAEK